MSRLQKILIGTFGALFLFCLIIYRALSIVPADTPTPIVYPESGLSDNLFVSQNSKYIENDSLTDAYAFPDVPYYIDMPEGDTAEVGKGHIVYGNDNVCFLISEIDAAESYHEAILSQYPPVVYINYSQDSSYSQTVKEGYGYINGLTANYFVDHLLISTGVNTSARSAYVIGYAIQLEEEHPYQIIVSVATTLESTESFEQCKQMLDALAYTIRYDEKLDNEQIKDREEAAKKAEKEAQEKAQEEESRKVQEEKEQRAASEAERISGLDSARQIPVDVTHDFNNLSIIVTWSSECKDADITFLSSDGFVTVKPSTKASKQAIIEVGSIKADKDYYLNVTHYSECGDVSMKLIENNP